MTKAMTAGLKGIVAGFAIAYLGSLVLQSLIWIGVGLFEWLQGATPRQLLERFADTIFVTMPILAACCDQLGSLVGGYVAGQVAGRKEVSHAVLAGVLSTVLIFIFSLTMPFASPAWYYRLSLALFIPTAALGGLIRRGLKPKAGSSVSG